MIVLKELWMNKNTFQGSIDITVFFVNVLLFLCHVFLMVFYIVVDHHVMICANIVSLFLYSYYLFSAHKKVQSYMYKAFFEIWIHMILAVLSFGWTPGFQNWTYGLICAFFLPSFSPINSRKRDNRPAYVGVIFVLTYYILKLVLDFTYIPFRTNLDVIPTILIFSLNSLVSFVTITMFTFFYARRANRREHELSRRADYDELTSLYNRHSIHYLCDSIKKTASINKTDYSIAIIDIDHFKNINDKYGHTCGDEVLKEIANILRASSIKGIVPGRWGGEEFVMIAPYNIDYSDFVNILERLRKNVEKRKFEIDDENIIDVTISIGVSPIPTKKDLTVEEAVDLADKNLYEAKEKGRNRVIS